MGSVPIVLFTGDEETFFGPVSGDLPPVVENLRSRVVGIVILRGGIYSSRSFEAASLASSAERTPDSVDVRCLKHGLRPGVVDWGAGVADRTTGVPGRGDCEPRRGITATGRGEAILIDGVLVLCVAIDGVGVLKGESTRIGVPISSGRDRL